MLTEQEEFWKGDFGVQYVERNRIDWRVRIPFWRAVLGKTQPVSVLEVGCNIGSNLKALREIDPLLSLWGVDINREALAEAENAGLSVFEASAAEVGKTWPQAFDLTFTAGMLIHVGPDHIRSVMQSIVDASRKYVLAVEYADEKEVEIPYRGHAEKLWRRPFGDLYQHLGLKLIRSGLLSKQDGFDDCAYWLMSR